MFQYSLVSVPPQCFHRLPPASRLFSTQPPSSWRSENISFLLKTFLRWLHHFQSEHQSPARDLQSPRATAPQMAPWRGNIGSPRNLIEIRILQPHVRCGIRISGGGESYNFTSLPGDSDAFLILSSVPNSQFSIFMKLPSHVPTSGHLYLGFSDSHTMCPLKLTP